MSARLAAVLRPASGRGGPKSPGAEEVPERPRAEMHVLRADCPFCKVVNAVPVDPAGGATAHATCGSCYRMYGIAVPRELRPDSARPLSARLLGTISARLGGSNNATPNPTSAAGISNQGKRDPWDDDDGAKQQRGARASISGNQEAVDVE